MTRKQFLIAVGISLVILAIAGVLLTKKPSDSSTIPATNNNGSAANGVTITNISQYSNQIDVENMPKISEAIYTRIKESVDKPAAAYDATVRPNSLTTVFNDYEGSDFPEQVPTTDFLVDIPKAQRTYKVSLSGGLNYPYNILYVLCPPAGQNAYAPFTCSDET